MRRVLSNITWLTTERFLSIALLLFLEGYLAKNLSVDEYGSYQYYLNISLIVAVFLNTVPAEVVIPKISKNISLSWSIIFVVFASRVAVLITFILISLALYYSGVKTLQTIILFSTALLLTEAVSVVVNYYQAIVQVKYVSIIRLFVLFVRVVVIMSLSIDSLNIEFIAWVRVFESLLLGLFLFYLIKKFSNIDQRLKFRNVIFKIIITNGLKIWPSIIIYYMLIRFDRVAVGYFFDMESVAYYSVSQQILDQVSVLLVIVASSIFPFFIYSQKNYLIKRNGFFKSSAILLVISFLFMFLSFLLSTFFITYVYGERYLISTSILNVMIWVLPLSIIDYSFSQYFISINRPSLVFIKNLIGIFSGLVIYLNFGSMLSIQQFPIILIGVNLILLITSAIILVVEHENYKINN